ncbi:MAG: hypothetical protein IPH20_21025 [Bacteroidales bacterium]|nr:hypothetical protein [Bacteroidales bacterium]
MRKTLIFFFLVLAILKVQAQDYRIDFSGAGDTYIVNSVIVDNLTSGATLTLNGTDILHLTGIVGENDPVIGNRELIIYPNPMTDQTFLEIIAPVAGEAVISIVGLTGKTEFKRKHISAERSTKIPYFGHQSGNVFYQYFGEKL